MAGSGKVAVLATLMFALLLGSSLVEAARPIVAEGSTVAADGTVVVREAHVRQLKTFGFRGYYWPGFWGWGWGGWRGWGWGWGRRRHTSRKLNTYGWSYWPGFWGWGWGGWRGYRWPFWG